MYHAPITKLITWVIYIASLCTYLLFRYGSLWYPEYYCYHLSSCTVSANRLVASYNDIVYIVELCLRAALTLCVPIAIKLYFKDG